MGRVKIAWKAEQVFQKKLHTSSPPQSEHLHLGPMIACGQYGQIGQSNGSWIRSLSL